MNLAKVCLMCALSLALAACTPTSPKPDDERDYGPPVPPDLSHVPDAEPRHEVRTIAGNKNPYTVLGRTYHLIEDETGYREQGLASWYGKKFHGRKTSNGEVYDMYAMTAAHKKLPIPSYVRVTNLDNDRSVVVRVNDRGPFHDDRIIDLSYAAAHRLGFVDQGVAPVEVAIIIPDDAPRAASGPVVDNTAGERNLPEDTYLQVGAFGSREGAERKRQRLESLTGQPTIIRELAGERPIYRVWVGPIDGSNRLQALREQLQQHGITHAHVVYP